LFGCALRLDAQGNLQAGFRAAGAGKHLSKVSRDDDHHQPPPAIYRGGNFVLHGAGRLPPLLLSSVTGAYVWAIIDELKTAEGMVLRGPTVAQFRAAVAQTSADVQSLVVLTQPGDKPIGVYTNDFLVVRAASAQAFTDNAKEVMRLWNSMNRDAQAATNLVFDVEEVKFGERTATQYSLDIAAADGAPELPEIRQAMEQLFGPGGKLRLWIVPVDDRNVLLASGTQEQLASALKSLDRNQPIDWNHAELSAANSLLPADADWRLFFSPHHYNRWYRRQMDAVTGPVIGGPLVKDFPSAPPIGVAGGVRRDELWLEAAIPAETIKSAGIYLKK
jgi:hypothetical protein